MHSSPIEHLRSKRILYVAYPLLTVSSESAGGAEQMLWTLEREMARCGVRTTVAASAGSCVSGELFSTGEPCRDPDDFERRNSEHQQRTVDFIRRCAREGRSFDLVHDKSGSFWPLASEIDVPVLATLHLPRHFYPSQHFTSIPNNVSFNCVSASQAQSFAELSAYKGVISNGIALDLFEQGRPELPGQLRHGLLWLGRICAEKAPHLALEIAHQAEKPITLAGHIYPFSYHQQYFDAEVAPRLQTMPNAEFVSLPSLAHKRHLLCQAEAILITSLVDETSSLVAMEAAAAGTPVIAFARGALPEIVRDGVTGFLVNGVEDAVGALRRLNEIDLAACLHHARRHFSSAVMAKNYARLYQEVMNFSSSRTSAAEI